MYIITSDSGGDFETSGLITLHNLCVLQPIFIYINSNLANKYLKTQTKLVRVSVIWLTTFFQSVRNVQHKMH